MPPAGRAAEADRSDQPHVLRACEFGSRRIRAPSLRRTPDAAEIPRARPSSTDRRPTPVRAAPIGRQGGPMAAAQDRPRADRGRHCWSRPPTPGAPRTALRWRPPVTPVTVVRPFDPPAQRWLPGHRGVDLRTTVGARVRAAGAGRVAFAGNAGRARRGHDRPRRPAHDLRTGRRPWSCSASGSRPARRSGPSGPAPATAGRGAACTSGSGGVGSTWTRCCCWDAPRPACARGEAAAAQSSSKDPMRVRMPIMALECSWQIRLSVTPSTRPISERVRPS